MRSRRMHLIHHSLGRDHGVLRRLQGDGHQSQGGESGDHGFVLLLFSTFENSLAAGAGPLNI